MTQNIQVILSELRERLQELYGERLVKLVLFGSRARGDAEPDSDIDVLIVLRGTVDTGAEIQRVVPITAELSLRHNVFISCAFVSAEQYDHDDEPLLMNVRREGVDV